MYKYLLEPKITFVSVFAEQTSKDPTSRGLSSLICTTKYEKSTSIFAGDSYCANWRLYLSFWEVLQLEGTALAGLPRSLQYSTLQVPVVFSCVIPKLPRPKQNLLSPQKIRVITTATCCTFFNQPFQHDSTTDRGCLGTLKMFVTKSRLEPWETRKQTTS